MSKTLRLLALLAAGLGLGCGGTQTPATVAGTYHGPNELDFLVTAPVRRQMPPEVHNGAAEVVDDAGAQVTLELRMIEGGDVCRLEATRAEPTATTLSITPGQECRSRFAYEGAPTAAVVTIEEGTVQFGDGSVEVQLGGSFVAATAGATESSGVARWTFEGTR